jgi:hypothetical protein
MTSMESRAPALLEHGALKAFADRVVVGRAGRDSLVPEPLGRQGFDEGAGHILGAVEQVWGNLKGSELANLCPETIGEAEEIVDEGLCRIGNDSRLAFSFLRHCGLTL